MKKTKWIAVMLMAVMATSVFSGCTDNKTAVSIGDVKIPTSIFTYLMEYTRYNYEQQNTDLQSNPDLWNTYKQNGKVLIDLARDSAKEYAEQMAVYLKKAKDEHITLTDKEQKSVKSKVTSIITNMGGETAFTQFLKEMKIDRATFEQIEQYSVLMNKVDTEMSKGFNISDADVKKAFETDYVGAKHILIKTIDDNNKSLSQDQITAANAKAEDILKQVKSGANFDELVNKYSEDKSNGKVNSEVMVFTKGQMVSEFENAAFKLKVGEISDVVRTQYGFHIIKRYDISSDPKYFTDNKDAVKKTLVQDKLTSAYKKWKKEYKITVNDKFINSYKYAAKSTASTAPKTGPATTSKSTVSPSPSASSSAK